MRVVGLMSGTSMDSIDAAIVDIESEGGKIVPTLQGFVQVDYPPQTRAALDSILRSNEATDHRSNGPSGPFDAQVLPALTSLNFAIGEAFAEAAILACKESGGHVDLIGSHGQTICHQPRPPASSNLKSSTLQIGEAAIIAQRTGVTTISDFRVADIAEGGEGAPLVSYVDYLMLRSSDESRAALNIGGIANLTLLPANARIADVRAFDSGPGNMPLDLAIRLLFHDGAGFDRNGQIAARGTPYEPLLEWLQRDTYFSRSAPKSAGREQFGPEFVDRAWTQAQTAGCTRENFVATLTELTARTIAGAVPDDIARVIASGGGVHNKTLMGALARRLSPSVALVRSDEFGLPVDAKEAIAFAVLAFEAVHGRTNNIPRATGAAHPTILGKVVPGANFSQLMQSVWK